MIWQVADSEVLMLYTSVVFFNACSFVFFACDKALMIDSRNRGKARISLATLWGGFSQRFKAQDWDSPAWRKVKQDPFSKVIVLCRFAVDPSPLAQGHFLKSSFRSSSYTPLRCDPPPNLCRKPNLTGLPVYLTQGGIKNWKRSPVPSFSVTQTLDLSGKHSVWRFIRKVKMRCLHCGRRLSCCLMMLRLTVIWGRY